MIKSMTGYGGAKGAVGVMSVSVELKSVNNRYLDVSTRLPRNMIFAEDSIKTAVQGHISRGKVDVFVTVDIAGGEDVKVRVNEPLLRGYMAALDEIYKLTGLPADAAGISIARLPEVLSLDRAEQDNDAVLAELQAITESALGEFDAMRLREGEKLRGDVLSRLDTIETLTAEVEKKAPATVEAYRARLEQKLREVLEDRSVDEARIVAEAAIFADRIAVDEETVRLRSHISQLRKLIIGESPAGRKMDFLIQELNREANTIGSKCQSSEIAYVVVDLKAEIEKIREQIQNVE